MHQRHVMDTGVTRPCTLHSLSFSRQNPLEAHQKEQLWLSRLSMKMWRNRVVGVGCGNHQGIGEGRLQARRHLRGRKSRT